VIPIVFLAKVCAKWKIIPHSLKQAEKIPLFSIEVCAKPDRDLL